MGTRQRQRLLKRRRAAQQASRSSAKRIAVTGTVTVAAASLGLGGALAPVAAADNPGVGAVQLSTLFPADTYIGPVGRWAHGLVVEGYDSQSGGTSWSVIDREGHVDALGLSSRLRESSIDVLEANDGRTLISADDLDGGEQLWLSDGTADGTVQLTDFPASDGVDVRRATVSGERVYFDASAGSTRSLWSATIGDVASTAPVEVSPGQTWDTTGAMAAIDGGLVFVSNKSTVNHLFAHTAAGTTDLGAVSGVDRIFSLGDRVVFKNDDEAHGGEPWVSDGTVTGTHILKDLEPGTTDIGYGPEPASSNPTTFTGVGDKVFFAAYRDDEELLFASDGTTAGTREVPGITMAGYTAIADLGGRAVVVAEDESGVGQLVATDGTQVEQITRFPDSAPGVSSAYYGSPLLATGGRLYFVADTVGHGAELWSTDGTPAGSAIVTDALPGWRSSYPYIIGASDSLVSFAALPARNKSHTLFVAGPAWAVPPVVTPPVVTPPVVTPPVVTPPAVTPSTPVGGGASAQGNATAFKVSMGAKKSQKQRKGKVKVVVRANATGDSTTIVGGTVRVGKKSVQLRTVTVRTGAGAETKVSLGASKKATRSILKAIAAATKRAKSKAGKPPAPVVATITVRSKDATGVLAGSFVRVTLK